MAVKVEHPGQHLSRFLYSNFATQEEAALAMRVSRLTVNEICRGRRKITPDMALRLGRLTATPAEEWLLRQAQYDLWVAMQDAKTLATLNSIQRIGGAV